MKFLLPVRHGLRAARQHPGLVLILYLVTLLPTLVLALLAHGELSLLDGSLFAAEALDGNRVGVWSDLTRAHPGDLGVVVSALRLLLPLLVVLQILVAAGVVEALLDRERKREHPFLLGVGRHGWRFVRAAVWFAVAVALLAVLVGVGFGAVNEAATEAGDGRVHLAGWGGVLLLVLLLFIPLDLAYDLSRIAAVAHDEGRTFVGFFKALGHALRHPLILLPLWLVFTLFTVGWHVAYVVARASWGPAEMWQIVALLVVQQLVFLLAAFFRIGLWGAEIAYYQAMGEPRWCGRMVETRAEPVAPRNGETADDQAEETEPPSGDSGGGAGGGGSRGWSGQLTGPARP